MLEPQDVISILLDRRLIGKRALIDGKVDVENASRRNHNFRVVVKDGPSFLLKEGLDEERRLGIAHEAAAYRYLHAQHDAVGLGACLLTLCAYDAREHFLITRLPFRGRSLTQHIMETGRFSRMVMRRLGSLLALLHTLPVTHTRPRKEAPLFSAWYPWVREIYAPAVDQFREYTHACVALITVLQRYEEFFTTPADYTRCDASVLYLARSDYAAARPLLERLYAAVEAKLKPSVVLFCKKLAPGLGLAESPPGSESFGMHRSRLLAEGVIRAFEEGARSGEARLEVLRAHMADAGVTASRPYLNPGSQAAYPFGPAPLVRRRPRPRAVTPAPPSDPASCLHAAAAVGHRFVEQALWWRNRCNWLGGDYFFTPGTSQAPRYSFRALGPNLYSGVAGVALFLGELFRCTGEADVRKAALGAIRQASATADLIPEAGRAALYTGCPGISLAGVRLGLLFEDEALIRRARHLVRATARGLGAGEDFDLLSGRAGTMVALLAIDRVLDDDELVVHARRIGQDLIASAQKSGGGFSWRKPGDRQRHNLTGFSHGAAGVGYAFARLFDRIGEVPFRDAAEAAFRYERRHFDPSAGNWMDLRKTSFLHPSAYGGASFSMAWCHGAPGIALSRLCAFQAWGQPAWEAEARIALDTTGRMVEEVLSSGQYDSGLCHGVSGNADVLLEGARVFSDQAARYRRLATAAAALSARRFEEGEMLSFDGQDGAAALSLMTGLAGFGYFQLRAHTPRVPSVLAW